jgi:predicted phage terminase large subunit-like protein
MRLDAQSIKFESGRVYLPKQAPWLDDYIQEITGFPGTKHDDQVDSTSQALDVLERYSFPPINHPFRWPIRVYETC